MFLTPWLLMIYCYYELKHCEPSDIMLHILSSSVCSHVKGFGAYILNIEKMVMMTMMIIMVMMEVYDDDELKLSETRIDYPNTVIRSTLHTNDMLHEILLIVENSYLCFYGLKM